MFKFPNKSIPVFKNEEIQESFDKLGYAIIDFYDESQIQEIKTLYDKIQPDVNSGIYPSTFSNDKNYRETADSQIKAVANQSIESYFKGIKVVCGSFIVKYPGNESYMDVHQDMTLVDESKFNGINIWCPLIDLDKNNGVLSVLEGSHRLMPTYRGASIRPIYDKEVIKDAIKQLSEPIYLKAGQAIVFDQSIIHFSQPNVSNQPRIVTNIYFTQQEAKFQIAYHDAKKNKIEVFVQDDSFMTSFEQFGENILSKPKIGKSLGEFDYKFPRITYKALKEKYPEKIDSISFIDKLKLRIA